MLKDIEPNSENDLFVYDKKPTCDARVYVTDLEGERTRPFWDSNIDLIIDYPQLDFTDPKQPRVMEAQVILKNGMVIPLTGLVNVRYEQDYLSPQPKSSKSQEG